MITHNWIDYYAGSPLGIFLRNQVSEAVQFDCGDGKEIPLAKDHESSEAKPPFPVTLLQFETPDSEFKSHVMILFKQLDDGRMSVIGAEKIRGINEWRTTLPRCVTRMDDGSFDFEGYGYEEGHKASELFFATAMNFFYVLGCSNVETVNNPPPDKLNKKRAKNGKFPIFEYKTLVIKLNNPKSGKQDNGGTHASPRVHLRRGHVRKLQSGLRVWVQSCVVGSKHGVIMKDYKVSAN